MHWVGKPSEKVEILFSSDKTSGSIVEVFPLIAFRNGLLVNSSLEDSWEHCFTNAAALVHEYGFVGLQIRLRCFTNAAA